MGLIILFSTFVNLRNVSRIKIFFKEGTNAFIYKLDPF